MNRNEALLALAPMANDKAFFTVPQIPDWQGGFVIEHTTPLGRSFLIEQCPYPADGSSWTIGEVDADYRFVAPDKIVTAVLPLLSSPTTFPSSSASSR